MGKRKGKESKIRITRISKKLHSVDKPDRHRNRLTEPRRWGQSEERRAPGAGASIPRAGEGTEGSPLGREAEPDEGSRGPGKGEGRRLRPASPGRSPRWREATRRPGHAGCARCASPRSSLSSPQPSRLRRRRQPSSNVPKVSRVPGRPRTPSRVVSDRGGGPEASVPWKEVQELTHPRVPR